MPFEVLARDKGSGTEGALILMREVLGLKSMNYVRFASMYTKQ